MAAANEDDGTFSIVDGGPARETLRRLKLAQPLSDAALLRNALVLAAITWLPLAFLTVSEGFATGHVALPFVLDISAHVRFLLVVPLLILAEGPIGRRGRITVGYFVNAKLIRPKDLPRLEDIILAVTRLRDTPIATAILLAIVVIACWASVRQGLGPSIATWYVPLPQAHLSFAGYWYAFVCLPVLHFLILRWFYRLMVWMFFLHKISRLDLVLVPSHPDEAGGLGFVGHTTLFFGTLIFALSAMLSASVAVRVLFGGVSLYDLLPAYGTLLVLVVLIFAGPMLLFIPKLYEAKEHGLRRYGALASRYTRQFEEKWIDGGAPADEPLLGTGDIQSLADLANSYAVVDRMKIVPVTLNDLIVLAASAVVPALPLVLTVMPLTDVIKDLLKLVT
jgi:hypothetical protein